MGTNLSLKKKKNNNQELIVSRIFHSVKFNYK